jgi:hypothetical protein
MMCLFGRVAVTLLAVAEFDGCPLQQAPMSPAVPATSVSACARPFDDVGRALYETVTGSFIERRIDTGGANMLVVKSNSSAGNQAVYVTPDVYDMVANIEHGRGVTLVAYVRFAMAGANPIYSCVEF